MGLRILGVFLLATAASGQQLQQFQLGAVIGYGFYRNGSIFSTEGTAQAGIRNRFAAGIRLGYDFHEYVSCEFHYLYHDGHPFLQAPGVRVDIQGQSHALTAEALLYFKASSEESVGGGASANRLDKELPELLAGGIKRSLLIFTAVIQERSAEFDHLGKDLVHGPSSQSRIVVEIAN